MDNDDIAIEARDSILNQLKTDSSIEIITGNDWDNKFKDISNYDDKKEYARDIIFDYIWYWVNKNGSGE